MIIILITLEGNPDFFLLDWCIACRNRIPQDKKFWKGPNAIPKIFKLEFPMGSILTIRSFINTPGSEKVPTDSSFWPGMRNSKILQVCTAACAQWMKDLSSHVSGTAAIGGLDLLRPNTQHWKLQCCIFAEALVSICAVYILMYVFLPTQLHDSCWSTHPCLESPHARYDIADVRCIPNKP